MKRFIKRTTGAAGGGVAGALAGIIGGRVGGAQYGVSWGIFLGIIGAFMGHNFFQVRSTASSLAERIGAVLGSIVMFIGGAGKLASQWGSDT